MAHLHYNENGFEVRTVSHSSLQEFSRCAKLYQISRVSGFREPDDKAALKFGNCIEDGLIGLHQSGMMMDVGVSRFETGWAVFKNVELEYTDKEVDWETLNRMGVEMMELYESVAPTLPIQNPEFQLNYRKSVFNEPEVKDLKFTSFIDIVSHLTEDHPLLPAGTRDLIIDVKTTGAPYPSIGNGAVLRLDKQLRQYSWATGIKDVSFLTFVKASPTIKRGDTVTRFLDGKQYTVFSNINDLISLCEFSVYQEHLKKEKEIEGKGSKALKGSLFEEYREKCFTAFPVDVTKQRIQFLTARMTDEDLRGVGEDIGEKTLRIKECGETDYWPQNPGIRWPDNKCLGCRGLGICLDDQRLIEERLIRPKELRNS